MKIYTTVQGDMWDMIAHKALGSTALTDRLMMANRKYLDFYTFPAGIVLTVPEIEREPASEGMPPWKKVKA